jgi:RNA polymerase sigma-70 factor (ECF subfamily)
MTPESLPDSVPDDELLVRIAAGDGLAFTTLFRRRQADVYRVALLMTGMPAAAEDVTQEVFLVVMRDAARYEAGRSTVTAWLCGIARNHARRRLEREERIVPLHEDTEAEMPGIAVHPDPIGDLANTERLNALRQAVLSLPLRYREVVVLCDLEEISYADAAAALDCAVGTVRSRLHRARALLAAKMRARLAPREAPEAKKITRCLA